MNRLLLFLLVFTSSLNAQTDTIPIILTVQNSIYVEAIINGQDTAKLMFHTDADAVGVTQAAATDFASLKFSDPSQAGSWGGGGTIRLSENNTVQIGDFILDKQPVWETRNSGIGTDGKFGFHFFADKLIELDYEQGQMLIHTTLPVLDSTFQQLQLTRDDRGTLFIKGVSTIEKDTFVESFMIHSGYSGTILYNDTFAAEQGLDTVLTTISERELQDSFGNKIKTKKAMLSRFAIGTTEFTNLPVGFFAGSVSRQPISVLGADLLKRFRVIFNLKSGYIYLKSNGLIDEAYFGVEQ